MTRLVLILMQSIASLSILAGCGASQQIDDSPQAVKPSSGIQFQMRLKPRDADTSQVNEVSNPTADDVAKALSSIDWPNTGPWQASGSISTHEPHFMALKFEGTSTENVELQFSEQPDPDGKWRHRFAPSVSVSDAVHAFQSFARKQDDFRTNIAWEENE